MKVTFVVEELKARLAQLAPVVSKSGNSEQIYGYVRLYTEKGAVKFTGTGIDSTLTVTLPAAKADGDVDVALLFEKFMQAASALDNKKEAVITADGNTAKLSSGRFNAVIRTSPVQKFMDLGTVQALAEKATAMVSVQFALPGLKDQIEKVTFGIAKADGKNIVSGAKIESTDTKLRLVSTDGYRLVISDVDANYGSGEFLVPKAALEHVLRMNGGAVTISENEGVQFFETELELLTFAKIHMDKNALMDNSYKNVIPDEKREATILTFKDKDELKAALNRVRPFADDQKQGIVISADTNSATLTAVHDESGTDGAMFRNTGEDVIPVEVTGAPNGTKVDLKLLEDYLDKAVYPLTMHVKDKNSIIDFRSNNSTGYRLLMMPMRQE